MVPFMEQDFTMRQAAVADIPAITDLILIHGPNEWNHLPEEEVRKHVAMIEEGQVGALVAERRTELIGAVTYLVDCRYAHYQPEGDGQQEHGYLAEAVVHREHTGKGIGSALLRAAAEKLFARGIRSVYAKRHEENAGSAGMMRRSGFEIVDTFADPDIRPHGSRRTTVERLTKKEA